MFKKGIEGFPYYLGVNSLDAVATRADRVCVLNILGGESRQVTPVSHAFSGGNVVFGTSPGRCGQVLATSIGDIPVFNNVREGLDAGLEANFALPLVHEIATENDRAMLDVAVGAEINLVGDAALAAA